MNKENLTPYNSPENDPWTTLREFTAARIALGRTGVSEPLHQSLQFKLAHAHARDAVFSQLNSTELANRISSVIALPVLSVKSQVSNRPEYLQRPDLGRKLHEASVQQLKDLPAASPDIAIMLADGLSATAINQHAVPVLQKLVPALQKSRISLAPITIVEYGRVAISDEIGFLLRAKLALILIGERPGLSSPDSMGAYFTFNPQPGLTDESRNCLSNIRPTGLAYQVAADKLFYLLQQALQLKLSGVLLKDNFSLLE
ncbi:ethanolamine ammonia-lyase subunit EutC [Adhaeribacter pallidiroseus]|uniref:Ethanolamine ammonia-lyase small subunit n=1 Tax=Adhaeribacter pallidiroseus TaxID=2072847 RepID=A0A369QH54_9BACT|nr:ethanolamine ammonia-lyase subunit EutC [Adhaeribacter pallidiroseus]RDC62905.1 Ethanolamine ammonia-lyase [Adhaeribacter pallidiroseus]